MLKQTKLYTTIQYLFCSGWVSGKQSPVDVASVSQIRVVRVLSGQRKDLLYQLLGLLRLL